MGGTITIVVDNRGEDPLAGEHGFSALIEIGGKRVLFDTGEGDALFHNADSMGVSLSGLDALVLSHGHYDHGGNIAKILSLNPSIQFFAHPQSVISRWSLHPGNPPKSIGLTEENRTSIMNLPPDRRHWSESASEIVPGVWVTGSIPRTNTYEDTGGPFFLDTAGKVPDLLPDDMALWVWNGESVTTICGCCHSGLRNTVDHITSRIGDAGISTIIGGLHLLYANRERLNKTVSFIDSTEVKRIFPSHCTGGTAVKLFREKISAEVVPGYSGLRINI